MVFEKNVVWPLFMLVCLLFSLYFPISLLQHLELLEKISVFGHAFLDELDDTVLVDQISQTSSAVVFSELFLGVRDQRKFYAVFLDEFL